MLRRKCGHVDLAEQILLSAIAAMAMAACWAFIKDAHQQPFGLFKTNGVLSTSADASHLNTEPGLCRLEHPIHVDAALDFASNFATSRFQIADARSLAAANSQLNSHLVEHVFRQISIGVSC